MSDTLTGKDGDLAKQQLKRLFNSPSLLAVAARFALGFTFVVVGTLAVWPHLPKRYYSTAKVVMLTDVQDGIPDPSRTTRTFPDEAVTQSQIDLIGSPLLAAKVVEMCHLLDDPEFTEDSGIVRYLRSLPWAARFLPDSGSVTPETVRLKLEKRLYLKRDRKSYTVDFGYWSSDPGRAAEMTQTLLDAYIAMQHDNRVAAISRISTWLDARIAAVRTQAVTSENAVRSYMETSRLVDEGAQDYFQHELAELGAAEARAETDRVRAKVDADTLLKMQRTHRLQDAPQVIASLSIQKLRDQLALGFSQRPGGFVPQAGTLNSQIEAESDRIVAAAVIAAQDAERRKQALDAEIGIARSKIADRARAKLHLDQLRREAQANENVLSAALEKARERSDLTMSVAPEIQIAGLPEPAPKPSFPDPLLGLIGTILAGCLCGTLLNWREAAAAVAVHTRLAIDPA